MYANIFFVLVVFIVDVGNNLGLHLETVGIHGIVDLGLLSDNVTLE
jgi:hypothetical protein